MAQPFPRPRLGNNLVVPAGLVFPARVFAHPLSPDLQPRLAGISLPWHRAHLPSLIPQTQNHKTLQSGSSVSCTSCLAAFPRGCLRWFSEQDFPLVAVFSASPALRNEGSAREGARTAGAGAGMSQGCS